MGVRRVGGHEFGARGRNGAVEQTFDNSKVIGGCLTFPGSAITVRRYVALQSSGTSVCRMKNIVLEPVFMLGRTP
eukprot:scaffold45987_cov32-Attheya_sp.AAC.5